MTRRSHLRGRRPTPLADRLAAMYEVDEATGCWLWRGYLSKAGYARITLPNGKKAMAHRASYELHVGPIPDDLHLDHLCRTPRCINPTHLEPVTPRENTLRGVGFAATNSRKTCCPQGHVYDDANTVRRHGRRYCRECNRESCLRRYYAKKAVA